MLYGNDNIKQIILNNVHDFEKENDVKVVYGANVGSISKGMERYDSDYDTRFLYVSNTKENIKLCENGNTKEDSIHKSFIPKDPNLFYDKIAFWDFHTFINFLKYPYLDNKFSVGLYHIVPWTFLSPYNWDPYGIVNKIMPLLELMYNEAYEIYYYRTYILNCITKDEILLREYIYSTFYGIAINYCLVYHKFAPIYFPSLINFCDKKLLSTVHLLLEKYYNITDTFIKRNKEQYKRKMTNSIIVDERFPEIDSFLVNIVEKTERFKNVRFNKIDNDYVYKMAELLTNSMRHVRIKDVNGL